MDKHKQVDNILLDFLFENDENTFDEIMCSDSIVELLSDENCILMLTKRMVETEN